MPRTTKKNDKDKVEQPATSSDEQLRSSKSPDRKQKSSKPKKEPTENQVSATDFDKSLEIKDGAELVIDPNKVKSTVERFISDLIELNVDLTEANVRYLRKLSK